MLLNVEDSSSESPSHTKVGEKSQYDSTVPHKKARVTSGQELEPDTLADRVQAQSLQSSGVPSEPENQPRVISAANYMKSQKLRYKTPGERTVHSFYSHPWKHLLAPKPAPFVSPHYDSNIREQDFEEIGNAGYSGLLKGLFSKPDQNHPTACNKPRILDAVSPLSIESFRRKHSVLEMLELREEKKDLPLIPDAEMGDATNSDALVDGLVKDGQTYPVLYRIKTLFGTGVRLESVHIELCLPDRIDLYNISLDQFAICAKTGKRGFDISRAVVGDLVWVYSLVPTTKFASSDMAIPADLREASSPSSATIWRAWRFALIRHKSDEKIGYVVDVSKGKKGTTVKAYMNRSREIVSFNRSRARNTTEFENLKVDDFIIAPLRDRPLSHMVFCCMHTSIDARKELRAHMAEVIYIPPAPRVPFDIRKVPSEFSQMVQEKRRDFQTIKREPRRAAKFLDDLYSTTCGAIMALTAEQTDNAVYSVVWTPADINTYPAVVTFTIPLPHKSGWAVGNSIQGFFDVDEFSGTIHGVSQRENCLDVTAVLQRWDSLRWRRHALNSPNQRLAVGTCLAPEDDRANPTLALLEDQIITISWSASSPGWTSTQALLTTNVQLLGTPPLIQLGYR